MSKPRNQIVTWLKGVDIAGRRVLDVGAGPASKWARNWVQGEPAEYVTMDKDPSFGTDVVLDLNHPAEEIRTEGEAPKLKGFDVVFCLETLEHVWDPVRAARFLADAVKPGGSCYITVPFINPIHDKWDYLRYTGEWFHRVLPEVGFSYVEVHRRVATAGNVHLQMFYQAEGMRMSRIRYEVGDGHKIRDVGYSVRAVK